MSEDRYLTNPARDVEKIAAATVSAWLGDIGTVDDTSSGGGPDFWINYQDGRRGVGEVGWHEDAVLRQMWQRTYKEAEHHLVRLAPGTGRWAVSLQRGARIDRLIVELPKLIADLEATGSSKSSRSTSTRTILYSPDCRPWHLLHRPRRRDRRGRGVVRGLLHAQHWRRDPTGSQRDRELD